MKNYNSFQQFKEAMKLKQLEMAEKNYQRNQLQQRENSVSDSIKQVIEFFKGIIPPNTMGA